MLIAILAYPYFDGSGKICVNHSQLEPKHWRPYRNWATLTRPGPPVTPTALLRWTVVELTQALASSDTSEGLAVPAPVPLAVAGRAELAGGGRPTVPTFDVA